VPLIVACGGPRTSLGSDWGSDAVETDDGEGAEESGAPGESGQSETGAVGCEAHDSSRTSFDIDATRRSVAFESDFAPALDCDTTRAEVQGLGSVMEFD
jgi:hypothetical protein